MRILIIATRNEKKLRELRRYLRGIRAGVVSLKEYRGAPEVVENGRTFKANAVKKALAISNFTGGLVLADDSGLCVDALGGKPGVRSSRFAGLHKSDKANNRKLLRLLARLSVARRDAKFVCAIAIADSGKIVKIIEGKCAGRIALEEQGRYGFGYDPLFIARGYSKTFGQLGLKTKDRISHRSKALKMARLFLKSYFAIQ